MITTRPKRDFYDKTSIINHNLRRFPRVTIYSKLTQFVETSYLNYMSFGTLKSYSFTLWVIKDLNN